MEKNMRMKFLKQRITVILLLVASVCICGSINEFYVFENDYYFKYLLNTFDRNCLFMLSSKEDKSGK